MKQNKRKSQIRQNTKHGKKQGGGKVKTTILTPLTPKSAHKLAARSTQAEYAPTIRAAKAEKRASRNQEKRIGEMFGGLQNQIAESTANTEAAYNAANANMTANIRAAQEAAAKQQGAIAGQDAQFAALTGASPGAFSQGAQEANAAASQRALTGAALAAPIAAAGASQAAYLRNTGINARREGIQQHMLETKRRRKIKQDITGLKKERAGKVADRYLQIRGEEGDRAIQEQAFHLNQREAAQDAAAAQAGLVQDERASIRTRENNREDNAISRKNNREDNAQSGGKGGRTPSQRREDHRDMKSANITAHNLYKEAPKKPGTSGAPGWGAFTQLVAKEAGVDVPFAQRAVNRLRKQIGRSQGGQPDRRNIPPEDIPR